MTGENSFYARFRFENGIVSREAFKALVCVQNLQASLDQLLIRECYSFLLSGLLSRWEVQSYEIADGVVASLSKDAQGPQARE